MSLLRLLLCRFIILTLLLSPVLGSSSALAKEEFVSYRILPTDDHKAKALFGWKGKAEREESDDDFFSDSTAAQPTADPCKGDSIIGKVNCDVTDTVNKSVSGREGSSTQGSQSNNTASSATPKADLDLDLVPYVERIEGPKFKVTLVPLGRLTKENESAEERLDLLNDEAKVKDAIKKWEKIYTKDELKDLERNKTVELDISDILKDTKLLELNNKAVLKLDILPEPRLAAAYVIGDQSGHARLTDDTLSDEEEVNTNKFGTRQTRTMAVYMKDYDSTRDPDPYFTGEDGVSYNVIATKAGVNSNRVDQKIAMEHYAPKAPAGPARTELVLIRATMQPNTNPGFKALNYKGQRAYWPFMYSDLAARIEVARQNPQGHWEPTNFVLVGEKVRFQYHMTRDIDLGNMPITYAQGKIGANDQTLKASLQNGKTYQTEKAGSGFIYATKPFFITSTHWKSMVHPDAQDSSKIVLTGNTLQDRKLAYLMLGPDADFTRKKFLAGYAPGSGFLKVPVYTSPPLNTLWKDALRKSAACNNTQIGDWDTLPAREQDTIHRMSVHSLAFTIPMRIWGSGRMNITPSTDVMMGQHAALILMRPKAIEVLEKMAERFYAISQDYDLSIRYLESLPNFRFPENHPLTLTKVTMPDGEDGNYADIMADDTYLKNKYNIDDRTLEAARISATLSAADQMSRYIDKAIKQIRDADPCKTKDMIKVMGDMYGIVGSITKTSLMKTVIDRDNQREHWVSDEAARHWVDSAVALTKEVAARDREADLDTVALKFELLAATLVGAAGSGAPLVTDLLGLGVTGYDMADNVSRYMDTDDELALARGKAAVLGAEYYRKQKSKALTAKKFYAQMALDLFGMAMDGYSALNHFSRIWKARFYEVPVKQTQGLTADEIWARIERDAERAANPRLLDRLDASPTRSWDEALEARPEWRSRLQERGYRPGVMPDSLKGLNPDTVKTLEDIVPGLKGKKSLDAALLGKQQGLNNAETIVGEAWKAGLSPEEVMAKTGMNAEEYSQALAGYLKKGQKLKDPDKIMQAVEDAFDPVKREALAARMQENNPAYADTGHYPSPSEINAKTKPEVPANPDNYAPTKPDVSANLDNHAPTSTFHPEANDSGAGTMTFNGQPSTNTPDLPKETPDLPKPHYNAEALKEALESRNLKSIEDAGLTPDMLRKMEEMSKDSKVDYNKILEQVNMAKKVKLDDNAMLAGHAFSQGRDPVEIMRKYSLSEDQYKAAMKEYLVKRQKLSAAKADDVIAKQMSPESLKAARERQAEIDKIFSKEPDIREAETFMEKSGSDIREAETFMEESVNKAPDALNIKPGEAVTPIAPKADFDDEGTAILSPAANQNAPSSNVIGPNSKVRGTDETGKAADIELGDELGAGYFNHVYDVKRPDGPPVVARVSKAPATDDGVKIDGFGRKALQDADPDIVRAIEREKLYVLENGRQVEILKKVDQFAHQQIAGNPGGKMTNGQAIAFDKATRELNKKGYVWLDNHHKNYYFEKIPGTKDGWRVVIGDTGGVFKVKDINPRELQKIVSTPDPEFLKTLDQYGPDSGLREVFIKGRSSDMREKYKAHFDLDEMGIKDFDAVQFRSDGVVAYPKARELFNVEANPEEAYKKLIQLQ